MTQNSEKPLSSKIANAACGGPQGAGMDNRRNHGAVAEASAQYLAQAACNATPASHDCPPGYKRTEVGMIPEDWEVDRLQSLALFENGDRSSNYPSAHEFADHGVPFINAGHVSDGKIFNSKMDYIPNYVYERLGGGKVQAGDIVFCLRGSLGKFGIVDKTFGKGAIASSLVIVRPNKKKTSTDFVSSYFKSEICRKMIELWAGGAAQPNLGAKELGEFLVPVPPKNEQTAIANALSDVDALISSLTKLIAKKQAIKTATMQQLLTGRTRLPQFALREDGTPTNSSGTNLDAGTGGPKGEGQDGLRNGYKQSELGKIPEDWEVDSLGQLATIKSGGTPSTNNKDYWNGNVNWCTPTDITVLGDRKYLSSTSRRITEEGVSKSAVEILPPGTVVMTSRATIGECAIAAVQMTTNQGFKNFICGDGLDNEYFYYLLGSLKEKFVGLCSGSTFLEISTAQVRNFNVALPSKKEQTAIATILSDMDEEIQALQQRLAKTRQIKQGMMQELLTGKTRLVKPEQEVA